MALLLAQAPLAWGITTGSSNIRVSGIASHPDLDANVAAGWDYVNNNSITNDDAVGHGTSVAGIIGAVGNNSIGVTGINWDITMIPFQVLTPDGRADANAAVRAIEYATDTYYSDERIHVLNYSVSNFGMQTAILTAVQNYPGVFVWSAGNNGAQIDNASAYNLDNLISVGAIDSSGARSVWNSIQSSAFGDSVNIFAPGSDVYTTAKNNSYTSFGGTSAAAPNVTGAVALLLSYNPNLSAAEVKNSLINKADSITIEGKNAKRLDIGSVLWGKKYPNYVEIQNEGYFSEGGGGCSAGTSGWRIKVINNRSTSMRVIYNKRKCFEDDAKAWTGLSDIDSFELSAGASKVVEIDGNVAATHITFSYIIGNTRYITYSNNLNVSWNMIDPSLTR